MAILGTLCDYINFRINFSFFTKQKTGILVGIVLNLWMGLGIPVILTILNFLIYEHSLLILSMTHLCLLYFSQQCFVVMSIEAL